MKRVILASALIAISAFGAQAQQASIVLPAAIQAQILAMVPTADLSNLTTSQYSRLVTLFSDSKNLRAGENPVGAIKVILNAQ
jgi:hypothetical protein